MYKKNFISLDEAQRAVHGALKAALKKKNSPVTVAVVDSRGDLVYFARMDGAAPVSAPIAINKAYTSALTMMDTDAFAERDRGLGRELAIYGDEHFTYIKGGLTIHTNSKGKKKGGLLGGIGVSGRSPDEDESLASAGLKAIEV